MIGVVVFSRMNSTRLPGKALRDMGGRPLLGRILDRLRHVRRADVIAVATSTEPSDDPLAAFVEGEAGVKLFRGPLDDVSGRTLLCMRAFDMDTLVRICGDSPFEDSKLIDEMVALRERTGADIATNVFNRTFPSGLSVEVISRAAYERAYPLMREKEDFEHVTRYLYRHPGDFHIENLVSNSAVDLTRLNLCVDTPRDLERATWIATRLGDGYAKAPLHALIAAAESWYAEHPDDRGAAT